MLLCIECNILVCLGCITSPEHKGHTFKNLKHCLREADNNITEIITGIDEHVIPRIEKEISSVRDKIKKVKRNAGQFIKIFENIL